MSAPAPARAVASRVLERVETADAWADRVLDAEVARATLPARDVALATEMVYGTLRWQRYLDWILAPHSRRPLGSLDARVRVSLRMAAYQLVFLERVPSFAVVNDAVTLARGRRPGLPEYTNAVLRSFTRRNRREREPAPPRDPLDALATRCSFPTWIAARWVEHYGVADAEALMRALNTRPPVTLRVNTLRLSRQALAERLASENDVVTQPTPYAPDGLIAAHAGEPGAWRAFAEGACVAQDEASMLVARLLEPRPGETVADVCAAPGTKTTHLAQLMENRGHILAMDPQPQRLARVNTAAARLGISVVETVHGTVQENARARAGTCDAVLVDAPCSNLGVVRRNPEVKWRRKAQDLELAAERQREILAAAATMLKPGGRLVYATCSLEPEENDHVVDTLLTAHPEFRPDAPASFPVALDNGMLRLRPDRFDTDGFTAVRLRRA